MNREILKANEGKILTNGTEYGKIIYLAIGADPSVYYEITEEEYNKIMEAEMYMERENENV